MIPYNPCGAIVDVVRRPYRTRCRFFRDSEIESEIIWYIVPDTNPVLPFASGIVSSDWDVDERSNGVPWRPGIGEVWDAPRPVASRRRKPAATGQHLCGTRDQFENGAVYDPTIPPRLYRPDGLPTCCVQNGGMVWGGVVLPQPRSGLLLGGDLERPAGGLLLGGDLSYPAGGLLLGGDRERPAGGLLLGGDLERPAGGLLLGGADGPPPYAWRYQVTAGAGAGLYLTEAPPPWVEWWGAPAYPGPYLWQLEGPTRTGVAGRWVYTIDGIGYGIADGWDGQGSADFYFSGGPTFMATITAAP